MKKSRRELFESFARAQAGSLPQTPYEYTDWKNPTVNIDYHIEVDHHSVSQSGAGIGQECMCVPSRTGGV